MNGVSLDKKVIAQIHEAQKLGLNNSQIGAKLGIHRDTVRKHRDPEIMAVLPVGHPGTSTLLDADGVPKLQWIKASGQADKFEAHAREYIEELCLDIPRAKPTKRKGAPKSDHYKDLMAFYMLGDAHVGMLSWGEETGQDFDVAIAKRELCKAMELTVQDTVPSETAMICQMGDYFHMDDRLSVTPGSGNLLDVDGRYLQVMRAGISAMRHLIDTALTRHKTVRVRNVAGNHDPHSSITLTLALTAMYENEPRVIIEDSPKAFWCFTFGQNLVALTHGHQIKKPEVMAMYLAVEGKEHWSECTHKFVWQGHIHHASAKEHGGVLIESFRTLAGPDAWHAASGYKSMQEMRSISLRRSGGRYQDTVVPIEYVRKELEK